MTYQFDGYNHLVKLDKGELLIASLTSLAEELAIPGAWVSGLGAAQWAELGFYQLDQKQYQWRKFDQLMEITSLQGNIAWQDAKPAIHIHGTFSDSNFNAIGGHIKELAVGGTCEILLHQWYKAGFSRVHDDTTGLNLLQI